MSTISSTLLAGSLIAAVLIGPSVARAQSAPGDAPVSSQILNATRVFVSNAGSDSYGAESYFRLTKYDGGPDRAFHQFNSALRRWGKYEIIDSPMDADIVFAVRFASPIVDKATKDDLVYDPQLSLTIVDPKSRVSLWTITEHIQPANSADENNRNFDNAVARVVDRTRSLVGESTEVATLIPAWATRGVVPVGAHDFARRETRARNVAIGASVGAAVGAYTGLHVALSTCSVSPTCTTPNGTPKMGNFLLSLGSGLLAGSAIGWLWPVH
ncbi:MAG: hypothetical protein ABI625_11565 [bacterium]